MPGNEDLADFSVSYGPIMTSDEIWICRTLPEKKVSVMSRAVVRMHNERTRKNLPNRRRKKHECPDNEHTLSSAAENEKKHPSHAIGCCARHRKYFPNSRLERHDQRSLKDPSTAWRRTGFAVASCTSALTLLESNSFRHHSVAKPSQAVLPFKPCRLSLSISFTFFNSATC